MSNKLGVQNPITAGQYTASYNASAVADTDWHTLSSDDFYNPVDELQLASGLKFAWVGLASSSSSSISFLKLRGATGAGDGKGNTDGVIPVLGTYSTDVQALSDGSSVTSIAYAKGASGDDVIIHAGFNK